MSLSFRSPHNRQIHVAHTYTSSTNRRGLLWVVDLSCSVKLCQPKLKAKGPMCHSCKLSSAWIEWICLFLFSRNPQIYIHDVLRLGTSGCIDRNSIICVERGTEASRTCHMSFVFRVARKKEIGERRCSCLVTFTLEFHPSRPTLALNCQFVYPMQQGPVLACDHD